jgi:hypothetical protein
MSFEAPRPFALLGVLGRWAISVSAESAIVFRIEGRHRDKLIVRACLRADQVGGQVRAVGHILGVQISNDDAKWIQKKTLDYVAAVFPRRAAA